MIREDRFVLSRKQHAIKLDSFRETGRYTREWDGGESAYVQVDAVWYRRKSGVTYACIGHLWDLIDTPIPDVAQFLANFTDGRYGPTCEGRWDGTRYWGAQEPELIEAHLAVLKSMIADYPTCPEGYQGWWRF